MEGRSHLLIGLTAGVVLDSMIHLSGDPLTMAKAVPLVLIVRKAVYYGAVGFGALLPDIDNAHSIIGRKFGPISKEIQHLAGHRTLFHSILGLVLGSLLAMGLERLVIYLLGQRGFELPAELISTSHLVFVGILFGCIMHILADALTIGGVPLLWPIRKRYGFPPSAKWRFRTGSWPEFVIVWGFMILVALAIWQSIIII
ncbi:metal-dependent hydrolase [Ktedonosporobacter rubrisoli]|nr:metal-dependent hydrolase [Ktedonosporobacter rubrisoli]